VWLAGTNGNTLTTRAATTNGSVSQVHADLGSARFHTK
jgi:hypothetical protein